MQSMLFYIAQVPHINAYAYFIAHVHSNTNPANLHFSLIITQGAPPWVISGI